MSSVRRLQPQIVVQICHGVSLSVGVIVGRSRGSVAVGWPPEGEEIPDIAVAWRASVGLSNGDFEDRGDMSDPAFEARGRECQSFLQGERLIYGRSVMEKETIVGAVNVTDLRKEEGPGVWDGAAVGVVEVAVPSGPLGACCSLEMIPPEFNEVAGLVPFPWVAQALQIGMLEGNPGAMEEAVEKGVGTQRCLCPDQSSVGWCKRGEVESYSGIKVEKNG